MNSRLTIAVAFALVVVAARAADMSDKEKTSILNQVLRSYAGGDKASLDQLKKLPTNSAVPSLLIFFRQNFYTFRPTPKTNAEAMRIAKLIVELPDSAGYFKPLFRKPPVPNPPGWYIEQRNNAIDLLVLVDSKYSVRLLGDLLNDPDNVIAPQDLGRYLALLNIPDAPFSKQTQQAAGTPAGIAKWKEWWEANKAQFPEL